MAFAPAGGEAALGAWTLVAALGFVVCAGLLWIWRNTIGNVFAELASYKIGLKYIGSIHPLAPLGAINNAVEGELSSWADACQKQFGLALHYMAALFWTMSRYISDASAATLDLGHYIIHDYVPAAIKRDLGPLWNKNNKTAAVAAAVAGGLEVLKKHNRAKEHAQSGTNATTKATLKHHAKEIGHSQAVADAAQKTATGARTRTGAVIGVAAGAGANTATDAHARTSAVADAQVLPVPFGRTAKQMWRLLRRHEALFGATAMAAVMANVLGLASPRCLRDGPLGRISRRLCGLSSSALNDILGLLVDFLIVSDVCEVITLLNEGLSVIQGPLQDLTGVVDAALCHGDYTRPPVMPVPALSGNNIPAVAVLGV